MQTVLVARPANQVLALTATIVPAMVTAVLGSLASQGLVLAPSAQPAATASSVKPASLEPARTDPSALQMRNVIPSSPAAQEPAWPVPPPLIVVPVLFAIMDLASQRSPVPNPATVRTAMFATRMALVFRKLDATRTRIAALTRYATLEAMVHALELSTVASAWFVTADFAHPKLLAPTTKAAPRVSSATTAYVSQERLARLTKTVVPTTSAKAALV